MVHTSFLKFIIVIIALGYGVAPALAVPVDGEENPAQNPPPPVRQPPVARNPEDLAAYFSVMFPNTVVHGDGFVTGPTDRRLDRPTTRPVFVGSNSRPSRWRPSRWRASRRPPRRLGHVRGSSGPTEHAVMQNNLPYRIHAPTPWDDPIALHSSLDDPRTEDFAVPPQGDVPANNRPPPVRADERGPMFPPHSPPHPPP
jgi:hypothetical protein